MPATNGPDSAGDKTFGDVLREQSALIAELADRYAGYRRSWSQVVEQGTAIMAAAGIEPPPGPALHLESTEQQARLLSQAAAALALAHDDMIANGGPDDPDAYARYVVAGELYRALAAPQMPHEPTPLDTPNE